MDMILSQLCTIMQNKKIEKRDNYVNALLYQSYSDGKIGYYSFSIGYSCCFHVDSKSIRGWIVDKIQVLACLTCIKYFPKLI